MQYTLFKYKDEEDSIYGDLTIIDIDGEAWFVASEVCALLDIKNVSDAVSRLDDDEKLVSEIPRAGQNRSVNIVNESGLYNLIFRSTKPFAKKFRKWVTKEVIPAIRKTGSYGINRLATPNFVIRFNANWDRTEKGHFSVISELFIRLYGRFEQIGYQIPDKAFDNKEIRPDVSVGRLFAAYLRKFYPEHAESHSYYPHLFPSGLIVDARQYKVEILPIFIKYIDEVWLPNRAASYLGERDPVALDYLPKLIAPSQQSKPVA